MLLVHQTGSVKVGETIRYTLTYEPVADRILPSPPHLYAKIKNTSAIPLRAAYLHGPYTIHVAAYPSHFNPNHKLENPRRDGVPQFEPNLKAGGSFTARLTVPDDIRVTGHSSQEIGEEKKTVKWVIEITSQIIFSANAEVKYELLVSRDERSLDYSFLAVPGASHGQPGHVRDHQQGKHGQEGHDHHHHHPAQPKGVYSKAVTLVIDDTESLWNKPKLPEWEDDFKHIRKSTDLPRRFSSDRRKLSESTREENERRMKKRKKKKIHLVILTHGIHSNLGADMLYLKESIDAAAKQARDNAKKRREEARTKATQPSSDSQTQLSEPAQDSSIAPLSGGQEDLNNKPLSEDGDDDEQVIVRGFSENKTRTEKGIQYLGKRLARYVFELTYPDQPFKPLRRSMTQRFSDSFSPKQSRHSEEQEEGIPAHAHSTIRQESVDDNDLAYTFTSISFIGHSLGGLVQLYAIGYIQKHAPQFFEHIKPVNFITMASPLLGLSNENPMYVRFALDFGLVGRTGQDLGLTWRPPTLAKSGWSAMIGGLGIGEDPNKQQDPGAKPLLRVLPTGPAHRVLKMFRNRTVYSNVVNDGIVPLRTSCLLFLDWRGLERVEKARRENGLIGTMATWGWSELTGQNSSPNPSRFALEQEEDNLDGDETPDSADHHRSDVPQPSENETNEGDKNSTAIPKPHVIEKHIHGQHDIQKLSGPAEQSSSTLDDIWNFFRPTAKTTKKDLKMYRRSQTIMYMSESESSCPVNHLRQASEESHDRRESAPMQSSANERPSVTRGDSIFEDPSAPPKTTIFESAGDILNPPIPPLSWVIDPSTRARTIFHDRVYHPKDIPPPPRPKSKGRPTSTSFSSTDSAGSVDFNRNESGGMRVEEKIARAYHKDMSWRKVLVRLEPDAHNNMIVRRMFANAYGWPVIKHLCDTHFGDTYAASTRDEDEPSTDRAQNVQQPVGEDGETVRDQESKTPPAHEEGDMREDVDELGPLRSPTDASTSPTAAPSREDSFGSWDSRYFRDASSDEDDDDGKTKNPLSLNLNRVLRPPRPSHQPKRPSKSGKDDDDDEFGSRRAEQPKLTNFLSEEASVIAPVLEGHRGLGPVPIAPAASSARSTVDVGLRKSFEEAMRPGSSVVNK